MNTPRKTDLETIHIEIDELVKLNVFTPQRARALKDRLTAPVIEDSVRNGMNLRDIIDLHNDLLGHSDATPLELGEGTLFVTDWAAPWNSRRRKGQPRVTVWHRQTVLCIATRVTSQMAEYDVLAILEETGRPPTQRRRATGGAIAMDAIREGRFRLSAPTPEQLAMLPASERDIGEFVAEREYRIPPAYARRGLNLEHTGGGCTGLVLEFACGLHALVTAAEDASAPTTDHEPVDVGVYGPEDGDQLEYRSCENGIAAMTFLDELTRKYSPTYLPAPERLAREALLGAILYIRSQLGVTAGEELGVFQDDRETRERIIHMLMRFGQSVTYGLMERRGEFSRP